MSCSSRQFVPLLTALLASSFWACHAQSGAGEPAAGSSVSSSGASSEDLAYQPKTLAPSSDPSSNERPPSSPFLVTPVPERPAEPKTLAPSTADPKTLAPSTSPLVPSHQETKPSKGGVSQCPSGTCKRSASGPCEAPTGQLGNGCCACGADGLCASFCRCNGPDLPVDTPNGPKRIADLQVGDWVYSTEHDAVVLAPIEEIVIRTAPPSGYVLVKLENGLSFISSAVHPLSNGESIENLEGTPGVCSITSAPKPSDYTYDIAVASEDGGYFVGGILFATTLRPRRD